MNMHSFQDWETGDIELNNIVIINARVGKEAIALASLFKLVPSTLMMESGSSLSGMTHSENYVTFRSSGGKSFLTSESSNDNINMNKNDDYVAYYYPDVEDIIEKIKLEYPKQFYTNGLTASTDEDIHDMYVAFGMEVQDD